MDLLTKPADSRLMAETKQSLLESNFALKLTSGYAGLCSVSAANLLACIVCLTGFVIFLTAIC